MVLPVSSTRTAFLNAAKERILVLDGAMGTMIQALQFDEAAFRSARFADFHRDVKGNNDLLILTQPKAIEDIHAAYLRAGADIVATNTFSSTSKARGSRGRLRSASAPKTATRALSPAPSARPTAPPRFPPTCRIPATA